MKERPILFRKEMVQALLAGKKTQTRRNTGQLKKIINKEPDKWNFIQMTNVGLAIFATEHKDVEAIKCPYGKPGDQLWVRETMRVNAMFGPDIRPSSIHICYEAGDEHETESYGYVHYPLRLKHIPKIGTCLPYGGFREASRINLLIKDIRIERLCDISEADAKAEGFDSRQEFLAYVKEINKKTFKDNPNHNPWVWVIEFEVIND